MRSRFTAGLWFAAAALLPGILMPALGIAAFSHLNLMWRLLAPAICAFAVGFALGSPLLTPTKIVSAGKAQSRGMTIGILSWFLYCVPMLVMYREFGLIVMAFGLLFVAIPIALVGSITGWVLWHYGRSSSKQSNQIADTNRS